MADKDNLFAEALTFAAQNPNKFSSVELVLASGATPMD